MHMTYNLQNMSNLLELFYRILTLEATDPNACSIATIP